ncbi:hypothetical protein SEA_TOMAS_97 [Streptomyces phage Tomas]|uniref:Helix-turn-helix DNA binding domain protein n=1 Tax=Streptomyces phage Tomas TaxID=2914443 RepID=A0AA49BT04_9CAUD|nr:hypothetical protein PP453_gp182 [Streptomyces phage Tomas]UMO76285.1 hypothetical protein SEA_TOMAS_97 [Streptomyces phage Tomas]
MKRNKKYKNKVWLVEQYRTKTAEQIAVMCGVTEMTISRYLTLFKIPIRRSRGR